LITPRFSATKIRPSAANLTTVGFVRPLKTTESWMEPGWDGRLSLDVVNGQNAGPHHEQQAQKDAQRPSLGSGSPASRSESQELAGVTAVARMVANHDAPREIRQVDAGCAPTRGRSSDLISAA
jgi:hypothetical protein